MRTTIELDDDYRGRLLELAARRGQKGFSDLINEAVGRYLTAEAAQADKQLKAAKLHGFLSDSEADDLAAGCQAARQHWRSGEGADPGQGV
ncbi:MAG: ribbon-helix-helix protein, CopG family [Deltaproteobacteria bacterium]|nr:ribbon-helix-helix protein, CopG family [Deltaproteobacteria bacterium]